MAATLASVVHEGTADVGAHVGEAMIAHLLLMDALGALVGAQAERIEKTLVGSFLALLLERCARDDLLDVLEISRDALYVVRNGVAHFHFPSIKTL